MDSIKQDSREQCLLKLFVVLVLFLKEEVSGELVVPFLLTTFD